MESKKLCALFKTYLDSQKLTPAKPGEAIAYLYGRDEVSLDRHSEAIRLPFIGWVATPGLGAAGDYDWAAIINQPGGPLVVLGADNPYDHQNPDAQTLPRFNGEIRAIPHALVKKEIRAAQRQRG